MAGQSQSSMPALESVDAVLNSLPDGAYITDKNRRIIFWNDAAERITGWSFDDVRGRCCRDNILIHVDKDGRRLCGEADCPMHRSIATGTSIDEPVLVYAQTRRGKRVPVEVTVSPLRDTTGEVVGGIQLFRDMTHQAQDLMRAMLIQRSLNGGEFTDPRVEIETCYMPREIVGGDLYRMDHDGADGLAILLADVPRHGSAAALFTMLLRSLWAENREAWPDPACVLDRLNKHLYPFAGGNGYFATAIVAHLHLASGTAQVALAGHPPPFVFGDSAPVSQGRAGLPLGMLDRAEYTNQSISLAKGDTMLFLTDGAFEVCNPDDRTLGMEELITIAEELRKTNAGNIPLGTLEERLLRDRSCIRLPDDLTMIKVRRRHDS